MKGDDPKDPISTTTDVGALVERVVEAAHTVTKEAPALPSVQRLAFALAAYDAKEKA